MSGWGYYYTTPNYIISEFDFEIFFKIMITNDCQLIGNNKDTVCSLMGNK